jgi:hypothetical protein
MPRTGWTPSIVPNGDDQNVYIVLDDFGRLGRSYRETDPERADLETTISDLMTGQFNSPVRVVAFNTAERWAEDASEDIARESCGGLIWLVVNRRPRLRVFWTSILARTDSLRCAWHDLSVTDI